jgi:hypothetical protein
MQYLLSVLFLVAGTSATLAVPSTGAADADSARTQSILYPLILNPWQISHWKCFGTTLYQNTAVSDVNYEVDICFTAAIAAKLLFPWFYQFHTGSSLLQALNLPHFPADERQYSTETQIQQGQEQYQEQDHSFFSIPAFKERLSSAFQELTRAVRKVVPTSQPAQPQEQYYQDQYVHPAQPQRHHYRRQ